MAGLLCTSSAYVGAYRIPWEPAFSLENSYSVVLCGASRFESDFVAQSFEPPDKIASETVRIEPIKIVTAQIVVFGLFLLQIIRNHQDAVSDRDNARLLARLGRKAAKLHRQVGAISPPCGQVWQEAWHYRGRSQHPGDCVLSAKERVRIPRSGQ